MPRVKKAEKAPSPPPTKTASPATASNNSSPRRLRLPPYRPFPFGKRFKRAVRLPSVWRLTKHAALLLWCYHWQFLGIALIYGALSIALVQSLTAGVDVTSLKEQFNQLTAGSVPQVAIAFSIFTTLLTSSNSTSTAAGANQVVLTLLMSLATIWALRQAASSERFRLRDPFYKGMTPLVPFILVFAVILIQCLPFIAGAFAYTTIISNGIAVYLWEKAAIVLLFLLLAIVSAYFLTSSLFALYIVTLPGMTPLRALRDARQLVSYRRLTVFLKVAFLPILLFALAAVIMVMVITFIAPLAQLMFFALTPCGLIVTHAYLYTLYRELLKE